MLLAIWQFGAPMVIFLAGLKQMPDELYEAAVGRRRRPAGGSSGTSRCRCSPRSSSSTWCWRPSTASRASPPAFVLSNGTGGPVDSTLMYTLYLYIKGFTDFQMGYASAMAWVFLLADRR